MNYLIEIHKNILVKKVKNNSSISIISSII